MIPNLLKQTHRKIRNISDDSAYDTKAYHEAVRRKRALVLIPSGYHRRSISETANYRIKQLLRGTLSMRNYNAQVGETYAMIRA